LLEQLLDEIAEEAARKKRPKRYLITSHVTAKTVQLRLLRQRVVVAMALQISAGRRASPPPLGKRAREAGFIGRVP
jgi:hypothetical protein